VNILFFVVSFLTSIAGAICGIGGGVVIKPTMDMFGFASVSTISFLSGCTVLAMSFYNVSKNFMAGDGGIELKTGTPLVLGAVVGGIIGKQVLILAKGLFDIPNRIGALQAGCLAILTLGTLIYTINKMRIKTYQIENTLLCALIGLLLGFLSSFLGIGGGPINLVALYFFFSMNIKKAAQNSLYIILFSQISSLAATLWSRSVPEFTILQLVFMVAGGILGGMVGRRLNTKMDETAVGRLFQILMIIIILISIYNVYQYL